MSYPAVLDQNRVHGRHGRVDGTALAWTVFYGWGWIVRKMPLLAWLIALPVALAMLAVPCSLFGFLFYKLLIE